MLLRAIMHWPQATSQVKVLQLWPFAMDHAINMWNNMPSRRTHKSPVELFTSVSHENYDHLQRSHVWGSPIYVLQPELQDAKKIGKWQPRARRDMFLGVLPEHSSNVVLALNLITGYVSPQFHTVHDDLFSTVSSEWDTTNFDPTHWHSLLRSGQERYGDPSINPPPLSNEWLSPAEHADQEQRRLFHRRRHDASHQREFPPPPGPLSLGGGYLSQQTFCLHKPQRKLVLSKLVLLRVIFISQLLYL
jgi:hypothetical protein